MAVPYQRVILLGQREQRSKENPYAMMNIDALQMAMKQLNGNSGLLLWLYLNKNSDTYFPIELSQKACAEWGLTKDSYYRAFEELVKYGYLRQVGENSNLYNFFENGNTLSQKENDSNTVSQFAKEVSQGEKELSHSAKDLSQKQQRKNTDNTVQNTLIKVEAQPPLQAREKAFTHTVEANYPTIDIDTYNSLLSAVENLGGGLIKLENGRIFKLQADNPFSQPLAYLKEQERMNKPPEQQPERKKSKFSFLD